MIGKLFAPLAMKIAAGLQLVSLGFIVFLLLAKAAETRRADKWQIRAGETQAAFDKTVSDYRRVRAEQKAADAEHARKVEQAQAQVSQEVSSAYQATLTDLRRRYDALRLRSGKAPANPGGSRSSAVPVVSGAASGPDDPAREEGLLGLDDRFICSAQAYQLEALQNWLRMQSKVVR